MKLKWLPPDLRILDLKMTMQGAGIRDVDATFEDTDEVVHLHMS